MVFASFFATSIKVGDDFGGASEKLGAFDAGFCNRDFAVGATLVKGKLDSISLIIPIEGVFHFVTIVVIVAIGDDFGGVYSDAVFAEDFDDQGWFLLQFVIVVQDLPGGGGEVAGVVRVDAMRGRILYLGGDGFEITGFALGDVVFGDSLTREGVPEKAFTAILISAKAVASRN